MPHAIEITDELKRFKIIAKEAIRDDAVGTIQNSGPEKAALLMSGMLDSARQNVFIYAQRLREEVSDSNDYYYSLEKCLDREGVTVNVILNQEENQENMSEARRLLIQKANEHPDRIHYYTLPTALDAMQDYLKDNAHFMTIDGKRYRFEYDIENCRAFASMNNPSVTKWLEDGFNSLMDNQ